MEFSANDWEQLLSDIQAGSIPHWLLEEQESVSVTEENNDADSMELLSPVPSKAKNGLFKIVPNFNFESANSDTLPTEDQEGEAQPGIDGRLAKLEG
jgi:hypothetical protein